MKRSTSNWVLLLVLAAFVTGLLWAYARDPFRRTEYTLKTTDGTRFKVVAVQPKPLGKRPVAIYLHGLGGKLERDGNDLRLIADAGLTAVGVEYEQTNRPVFDAEMQALDGFLKRQSWTKTGAEAWIGYSQGSVMGLKTMLRNPEIQPQLFVRWEGNWVWELDLFSITNLHCAFLLIHGENDERFPVTDARKLALLLQSNNVPVALRVLPDAHNFGADQPAVLKAIADYCAIFFGSPQYATLNSRPSYWYYWLPVSLLAIFISAKAYQYWRSSLRVAAEPQFRANKALDVLACLLGVAAVLETGAHLIVPRLGASPSTVAYSRRWLVKPELRTDFDWLAQQPYLKGQPIGVLLEHLDLANLQQNRFFPSLSEETYRQYVLSPQIGSDISGLHWRRAFWESFYPMIRNETNPVTAAQDVARVLRERVAIFPANTALEDIDQTWARGVADAGGFEALSVAALRSVGIPARLNARRKAEFWNGSFWTSTMLPAADLWNVAGGGRVPVLKDAPGSN